MSDQLPHVDPVKEQEPSSKNDALEPQLLHFNSQTFQCPDETQPIDRAVHLARLERCYPKCRQCQYREDVGPVSERRDRGIRTILSEAEPIIPNRFVIAGVESETADAKRFERWAAEFGLYLRRCQPERYADGRFPHVVFADASSRTMPAFVAAISAGLRWAGCDVTDLGRGAVGMLNFAIGQLGADAGLLLAQPGQWEHECGVSIEGVPEDLLKTDWSGEGSDADTDRPTRQLGQFQRASVTDLYLERFAVRYHGLRPLRIMLYTSCIPVVDALRRLTSPFDVQIEVLPYSVALREGKATDLFGAHFSVFIDGTGRVVELLDEQGVPFFADIDDLSPDAVEVVTAVQILLSRSETPLSELTFKSATLSTKKTF